MLWKEGAAPKLSRRGFAGDPFASKWLPRVPHIVQVKGTWSKETTNFGYDYWVIAALPVMHRYCVCASGPASCHS